MCWLQQSAQLWSYPTFLLIPLMGLAAVECFAGYRAWRFLLGANGAVLGFVGGASLAMLLGAPMLVVIGALAGGVAGAVLFTRVVPLGSIVFAFGSTASLVLVLARIAASPAHMVVPLAALAGSAGAIAALARYRRFMISITSVAGAQQFATAWYVYHLSYDSPPMPDLMAPSESLAFIGLAALGLLLQFASARLSSSELKSLPRECKEKAESPDSAEFLAESG
jgi:hypothetical protein